jgi:hypothetical protein
MRFFGRTGNRTTQSMEIGYDGSTTFNQDVLAEKNISGSATSTGSFGTVYTDLIRSSGGSGNVYIGTTANTNKIYFDPANAGMNSTANLYLSSNSGNNALVLSAGTSNRPKLSANSGGAIELGSNLSGSATTTGSFGAGYIDNKLGIGTTSPNYKLVVDDTGNDPIMSFVGNTVRLKRAAVDFLSYDGAYVDLSAASALDLNTGGIQRIRIDSSGHTLPGADDTYNLGSSSKRFSDVFAVQTTTGGVFEAGLKTEKIGDNPTGTIVSWRDDGLVPCDSNEDELVMGVIKNGKDEPIVLGAEPVLVTGKVDIGDFIVTSDKQGHGKSIKRGYLLKKDLFGKVIAQALEKSNDSDSSLIKCMIRKM